MQGKQQSVVFLSVIALASFQFGFLQPMIWKKKAAAIFDSKMKTVVISKSDPSLIYVATERSIYQSIHEGGDFKRVLSIVAEQNGVNTVVITDNAPSKIYAATNNGLYQSLDQGRDWRLIFHPSDLESRQCLSVIEKNSTIYLGTQKGLFVKNVDENNWRKIDGFLKDQPIPQIIEDQKFLFVVTNHDVFRFDLKNNWQKVFGSGLQKEVVSDEETDFNAKEIRFVQVIKSSLLVATKSRLYLSPDEGRHWQNFPTVNLPLQSLTSIRLLKTNCEEIKPECLSLLAATSRGVFEFVSDHWQDIHPGMETNDVRDITVDANGRVYAATDRGLFVLESRQTLPFFSTKTQEAKEIPPEETVHLDAVDYEALQKKFRDEPTIGQVHKWVIEYAEVHPNKIKEWRRLAQKKAWLPDLDIGLDGGTTRTIADSVYGSSSNGGADHIGPNDKSFDQDLNWDVSLKWKLGDLLWNSDQTSIDSRSKLMVELREDLLDQVTRLYFERRRLQFELAKQSEPDPQWLLDQDMRIEELTALIDAMTGGKFSKAFTTNSHVN